MWTVVVENPGCIVKRIDAKYIVAAGSVVTKSVSPDTMVAGNPAKIVKTLSKE